MGWKNRVYRDTDRKSQRHSTIKPMVWKSVHSQRQDDQVVNFIMISSPNSCVEWMDVRQETEEQHLGGGRRADATTGTGSVERSTRAMASSWND